MTKIEFLISENSQSGKETAQNVQYKIDCISAVFVLKKITDDTGQESSGRAFQAAEEAIKSCILSHAEGAQCVPVRW